MRRIPPARQEDPLAEDLVVGGEQRAQLGVGDLPAQVEPRVQRLPPGPAAVALQAEGHRLDGRVDGCARNLLNGRHAPVQLPHAARDRVVGMRDHPGRRPLEQVQPLHDRLDLGHHLDRGRARADQRDALSGEIVGVVPRRRCGRRCPGSCSSPGSAGVNGSLRRPGAITSTRAAERTGGRLELPVLRVGHPARVEQLAAQPDVRPHAEAVGAPAQVLEDLVAHRIGAVPVRVGRERERVEVRRDVALAAGVAVRPPGAADVVVALDHDEVVDALAASAGWPCRGRRSRRRRSRSRGHASPSTRGTLAEPYLAPDAESNIERRPACSSTATPRAAWRRSCTARDENIVIEIPPELSAEPDTYQGHDGVRRYFAGFDGMIEDVRYEAARAHRGAAMHVIAHMPPQRPRRQQRPGRGPRGLRGPRARGRQDRAHASLLLLEDAKRAAG